MADEVGETHTAWGPGESVAHELVHAAHQRGPAVLGWDGVGEPVVWDGVEEHHVWPPDALDRMADHVLRGEARARFRGLADLVDELDAAPVVEVDPGQMTAAVARFRELVERGELVHREPGRITATAADETRRP